MQEEGTVVFDGGEHKMAEGSDDRDICQSPDLSELFRSFCRPEHKGLALCLLSRTGVETHAEVTGESFPTRGVGVWGVHEGGNVLHSLVKDAVGLVHLLGGGEYF